LGLIDDANKGNYRNIVSL